MMRMIRSPASRAHEVLGAVDLRLACNRLPRRLGAVVADDVHARPRQAPRHAGAHSPQTDNADFHGFFPERDAGF
jgi:hypothetical protein